MIRFIIGKLFIKSPVIKIEGRLSVRFTPSRHIWQVDIYNEKVIGWRRIFFYDRHALKNCWIEADFVVDDEIPSIGDKMASANWGDETASKLILEPTSTPYSLELVSKIYGEVGFHIKKPNPETLLVATDCLAYVSVKTGRDETYTRAVWAIIDKGTKEQLDFIRLE